MELLEQDLRGKYWEDDYRRWHATGVVTESADKDLAGKLLSGNWQQEYSAAAELWMRTRFELLEGLNFEFQPSLLGKTPDFLIRDRLRRGVVADVTVLHSGPLWDLVLQQQEYQSNCSELVRRIYRKSAVGLERAGDRGRSCGIKEQWKQEGST